jgi:multidrug efflux pump subunit AcrA (membrane-fusion protein)
VPEGEGFKVFVVDATGMAHEREVKVGARTASGVEVLEGLKSGERIVTSGAYGMQDSAKVVAPKPDSAKEEKESDAAPPSKAKP